MIRTRSYLPMFLLAAGLTPALYAEEPESGENRPFDDGGAAAVSGPPGLGILGLPAAPLTGPIVTDRPDFTESAETIPYGHLQLEAGYTFTLDKENRVKTRDHTMPEFLLRIGLIENVELRIGWEGYSYTHTREVRREQTPEGGYRTIVDRKWEQGANDLTLGMKFKFVEQDGIIPHFATIVEMGIPTGSANVSPGDVEPGVVLLYAWDLNDIFTLSGNTGFFVLREGTHQFFQTTQSVSLAYAITDKLGGYVEYFGLFPDVIGEDCSHNLNTGFTYLLTENLQLDWRIGMGLNEQAPDFFTGIGFSIRF